MNIKECLTGVQHIGIPTGDMEKTVNFYKNLGFEVVFSTWLEKSKQHVNFLKLGDLVIETYDYDNPTGQYGAIDHIAINVKDINVVYNWACKNNLNTLNDKINTLPFWEKGVCFFTIEGPNKEKIEFSQYL